MKRRSGYSLLEALIALVILAVGIIALVKLFPIAIRNVRISQERTVVAELADDRLGQLRTVGARALFDQRLETQPKWTVTSDVLSAIEAAQASYSIYTNYTTTVQRMGDAGSGYLQRITFQVAMPDGRIESFVTYVADQ